MSNWIQQAVEGVGDRWKFEQLKTQCHDTAEGLRQCSLLLDVTDPLLALEMQLPHAIDEGIDVEPTFSSALSGNRQLDVGSASAGYSAYALGSAYFGGVAKMHSTCSVCPS